MKYKQLIIILLISISYLYAKGDSKDQAKNKLELKYLIYTPTSYKDSGQKSWPFIVFLHGMGERGGNLELLRIHGIPKITKKDKGFPFITLSPQVPIDKTWNDQIVQEALFRLLKHVISKYRIDKKRIYITGLSMGGYGTWAFAAKYPELFAAAVPICGGGDPNTAKQLKGVPIWVFHGEKDTVVPSSESEIMVNALKKINGNVKYTLYPNAFHDSWTRTYENQKLYEWLLSQRKK